jgi:hypothetical protein
MRTAAGQHAGMRDHPITHIPRPRSQRQVVNELRGIEQPEPDEFDLAAAAERRAALRATAGAEISSIEAQRDAELPGLAAAEERARRHLESLTPAYQEAMRAYAAAQGEHTRRAHDFAYARERQVRRVYAAAEPVIQETRTALTELMQATIATMAESEERNALYDERQGRWVHQIWSNAPSIDRRRTAILALFHDIEGMKAEPDQGDIRERLARLVEALPDASELVLVRDYPKAEPARPWPAYKQAREELIGRPIDDNPEERRSRRGILNRLIG